MMNYLISYNRLFNLLVGMKKLTKNPFHFLMAIDMNIISYKNMQYKQKSR